MLSLAPIILLLLPTLALGTKTHGGLKHRLQFETSKKKARAPSAVEVVERGLAKRYEGARITWYEVQTGNAGSCGRMLQDSEYVVALTDFDEGMHSGSCGKQIRITYGGKTALATIEDTCPGCPYAAIDLSPGLFTYFADQWIDGTVYGSWEFVDGSSPAAPVITTTAAKVEDPITTTAEASISTTSAASSTTSSEVFSTSITTISSTFSSSSSSVTTTSQESSSVASATQTVAASTPSSSPVTIDSLDISNLLNIAGLAEALGGTICRGSEQCA